MENQVTTERKIDVYPFLLELFKRGGSDMFFSVGTPPQIKVEGHTMPLEVPALKCGEVQQMAYQLMSERQIGEFERDLEMNLAVSVSDSGRFRINVYYQRGEVAMVARLIKSQIPNIESLGLPPQLEKLSLLDRGLILVIGAAGSGKSTTLAAMLDYRNQHKAGHIICIEDPIEFLHKHNKAVIDQREVGLDTHSFADALRNVLREAPDVIMLGEIRDLDSMQHALHYAETGHLVLATLHATSSLQAIERIVHFFPENARAQVLSDLSENLLAVIAQRLIPGRTRRRVAAVELMMSTPYLRDLVKRDELHLFKEALGRSQEYGLQTFDQHLYRLYEAGQISLEEAIRHADSRTDLTLKIRLEHGSEFSAQEQQTLRDDL